MAKASKANNVEKQGVALDFEPEVTPVSPQEESNVVEDEAPQPKRKATNNVKPFNPLYNGTIIVRYINTGNFDKNHFLNGGAVDGAMFSYCAPMLRNGSIKNVLTNDEKDFFEELLGISLSSMLKSSQNFWSSANPNGIGNIILEKGDNRFNMNDPMDYLRVKVLMANNGTIASSYKELQNNPKSTYRFVIVKEDDVVEERKTIQTIKREVFKTLENYSNNKYALAYIIYVLDHEEIDMATPITFMVDRVYDIFERSAATLHRVLNDKLFDTKVLIRRMMSADLIYVENDQYILAETNKPMRRNNNEADLDEACVWLMLPENSAILAHLKSNLPK